jgi:hypothetical protein
MSLLSIPLGNIVEEDIRRLIALEIPESPTLDFKQATYGDRQDDKTEFLADVSSFANTIGGDLVIGVAEAKGELSASITPFTGDCDAEKRRLEQIALSGLEPRISNLQIHSVSISSGGNVIIVRIPQSFNPPHRIIVRESNRFWARAGTTKYQPNVEQLRRLFNQGSDLAERVRRFQTGRLLTIAAGDAPVVLSQYGKVVVHVVPIPSFEDGRLLDIVSLVASGNYIPMPLDAAPGTVRHAVNLDGFVSQADRNLSGLRTYAQFFRNGAIESVAELRYADDSSSCFTGRDMGTLIVSGIRQYFEVLKSFNAGLPAYVFLSLCNATGIKYRYPISGYSWKETSMFGKEIAALPEIRVDDFNIDVPLVLRPIFNMLWNTFGFEACDLYGGKGEWLGECTT